MTEVRVQKAEKPPIGMPETVRIILEENAGIPPTGQFFGINGKGYMIRPGEVVDVPQGIIDILDNAVEETAIVDQNTQRMVGSRSKMRFPYRLAK